MLRWELSSLGSLLARGLDSEPSRASVFICVDWAILRELSRLEWIWTAGMHIRASWRCIQTGLHCVHSASRWRPFCFPMTDPSSIPSRLLSTINCCIHFTFSLRPSRLTAHCPRRQCLNHDHSSPLLTNPLLFFYGKFGDKEKSFNNSVTRTHDHLTHSDGR